MTACIVGWSHTKFGKLDTEDAESLIVRATKDALAHAEVNADEIDEIVVGNVGRYSPQDFPASLVLQADPAFRFKPASRVENACATGSAAIHQGLRAIEAKRARLVLVVGVEKMTGASADEVAKNLLRATYVKEESWATAGFASLFAQVAEAYFQRHGDQSEALAMIAAKNHRNGVNNPYAQLRKDLGVAFCLTASEKNPVVAAPLKRTDCAPISDGASALVLADVETALTMKRAIVFRAATHVNDYLPMSRRDVLLLEGCEQAWSRARTASNTTLDDLDFVETHDCFTIAELLQYEAMGLASRGEGARAIREGWTDIGGKLPVNPSGGLKSKGHPIGATGVSMHTLAAMQLIGEAGAMQLPSPTLAGVFNMGGMGVANYCSILERLR